MNYIWHGRQLIYALLPSIFVVAVCQFYIYKYPKVELVKDANDLERSEQSPILHRNLENLKHMESIKIEENNKLSENVTDQLNIILSNSEFIYDFARRNTLLLFSSLLRLSNKIFPENEVNNEVKNEKNKE